MLNRMISFALRNRLLVALLALGVAAYGTVVSLALPIDVLPDLNRPTVTILTEAHGLVPEDIEQLVTRVVEQSVNGATGVTRVRSMSGLGLSVVTVEFDWDTDIYRNRQIVQEKLQLASSQLPPGIAPRMAPISSIMGQIQLVGVRSRSGKTDPTTIRADVDQIVKLRLLSIEGVAQVVSIGGAPRQLQAIVDADKLRAYDVTLEEVAESIGNANVTASGGFLNIGAKGPLVSVTGLLGGDADLEKAVVREGAVRPVLLGDLARIEFGPAAIRTGDAGVNGSPGVILVVFKQPGVDTVDLSERLEAAIARIETTLPEDYEVFPGIYRQADFIRRSIDNVIHAVRDGSILVVIVLFLFLLNFRTTVITLTAIPMSIAITAIVFELAGISINTMTLGGLAVAIGALVDDAIVDVENVYRRLRQNGQRENPRSVLSVVFRASAEVRKPVLIGTLVVTAVYIPLFALSGMQGKLFAPVGIAYIVSIVASLFVALTLTPVLCFYLLPKTVSLGATKDAWLVRHLKAGAERVIRFSLAKPLHVIVLLTALVLASLTLLATRGTEFLPPFNEGAAQVNLVLPAGTNLDTANLYGRRLEKIAMEVDGVVGLSRRTGRAEGDEHAHDVNFSEAIISFDPNTTRSREEILADLRQRIDEGLELPKGSVATEQPLQHLLSYMLSGVPADVAIKVFGEDLAVLRRVSAQVESAIRPIEGVTDVIVEKQVLVEQVEVRPRRETLARLGVDVHHVAEAIELALEGEEVSRLIQGQLTFPIVVRLEEKDRKDIHAIRNLRLVSRGGERLTIGDVADVRITRTPSNVNRENVSRRMVVQHNVQGRALGKVVADVEKALDRVRADLPPGYSIRVSGQFEARNEATRVISLLSIVSLGVMILLIFGHFGSMSLTVQTLVNIPMAMIGAVAFVVITRQTVSVATLVGLISLAGIAARNKILLLDHYLHLMREEGEAFSMGMLVRAGQERIVPVLMTALTSGIALVPLVLAPGQPGREVLYPVASVIVGGLVTTTIADLVLTPALFWLFGRGAAERLAGARPGADPDIERIALTFEENHR